MAEQVKNDPAERDSVSKALRRNANPARVFSLLARGMRCVKERGVEALYREVAYRVNLMRYGEDWRFRADIPLRKELRAQRRKKFEKMPLISIVVPLYNTPVAYLNNMIKSVRRQSYRKWELVLVDASGPGYKTVAQTVRRFRDKRIVFHKLAHNDGIAENTNIGLHEAHGTYIALLDHDDTLSPNALYEVVRAVNEQGADFVYSDEIVLDSEMKRLGEYHFKPDFSPDTLRGCNYITHLSAFSRALLEQAGGCEHGAFNGAQDYDLILRLTEKAKCVVHVPKVLYYWRRHTQSTANDISAKPYAIEAGARAVRAQLKRLGMQGAVSSIAGRPGAYRVHYAVQGTPLVSVLIPNMDHAWDLERCVRSLYSQSGYPNMEVIIIENNSHSKETFEMYGMLRERYPNMRFVRYQGAFNFSAINNYGAQYAKGEYLLLLNNDVEILAAQFVREMLSYAQRPDVGAVGAKLFYPDDTIQHAGVFIGLGGSAGHSHKGHPRKSGGDLYRLATTQNVSAVTGACLMVKKSLYESLGGLDEENFAVAYNDVDFCLRLREQGYLNVMTPFAFAYHYESKSRGADEGAGGEKQKRYEAEKARFCARYQKLMQEGDPYYNPHFTLLYENYGYK